MRSPAAELWRLAGYRRRITVTLISSAYPMRDHLSSDEVALAATPIHQLSDAELERWRATCIRLSELHGSLFRRWLWRRRWHRAMQEWTRRTDQRLGPGPARCERCGQRRPTVHVVYERGEKERYGHYCQACSILEPSGWFGRVEATRGAGDRAS